MSNYPGGPPQQYDDAEIQRQLQEEEYRRRMASQGGGANPAMARGAQYAQQPYMMPPPHPNGEGAPSGSPYAYPANTGSSPYGRMPPYQMQGGRGAYPLPPSGTPQSQGSSGNDSMQAMYAQQSRAMGYGYDGRAMEQHYPYSMPSYGYGMGGYDIKPMTMEGDTPDYNKKKTVKKNKYGKPMLQKVTTNIGKPKSTAKMVFRDGMNVIEDGDDIWYTGCVPLGLEDDKYWLSELQVFLRSNFAEAFGATEEDIAAPMHGRNKPIALGQVGIRCMHCKQDNPAERGQQATSYPSLISGIYNSVQQMLRLHLECCLSMPPEVRQKIEQLKVSCSSRGGRKQYWHDSAKRLGLVDTPHGIHFGRDPLGPLPPLSGPSVNSKEGRNKKKNAPKAAPLPAKELEDFTEPPMPPPPVDDRPLVFDDDRPLISDYLYLTLEQMAPCRLMEADRVGCYKTRRVGFAGLACKHCVGQAGCGRYFPASEASLSQTTTSQTIMNHVRNCRRCPMEIRENLEIMKRNRMGPDGKRSDKPKHGGRKVFFHRLWCRIQELPLDEDTSQVKERKRATKRSPRKRRKDDTESEESEEESEEEASDDEVDRKVQAKGPKKKPTPWVHGCVRLTKTDDSNWLSDMECFARSDLVEVFGMRNESDTVGYGGRKLPSEGQVGIRCVYCKNLDADERPNNCVAFPDSLSHLHHKTTDMIRLHFPSCPAITDDARETFRNLKGFDARVANDDSQQYWVDSARDIGLSNMSPEGNGNWGITFRRDPLEPSPADELDLEVTNGFQFEYGANSLVREEDRSACTDQVMLLMRQVRPCCFRKSDRRAGPGSRGRDRSIGFPGLCCKHCAGATTSGRYFPVSAKALTDSTANSLAAHIASCPYSPEPIKASISYLMHRSIKQKSDLSGSWKKAFFKNVWDRLHVERGWTSIDDEEPQHADEASEGDEEEGEGEDGEAVGNQMSALIKAAAIWLNNQDAASDTKGTRSKRAAKQGDAEDESDGERRTRSDKKRRTRK